MKLKQVLVFLVAGMFAATAFSGEKVHSQMKIVVVDSDDASETRVELDSNDLDVELSDMQVGQNQSIVDKDGRSVLITRVEDGFTIDVDGKTVKMPLIERHGKRIRVDGKHVDTNVDVHVLHDGMSADSMDLDGVMIISGKEIDAATQALIRSALESAGYGDVSFAGGADGEHQVRVIRKVVHTSL